MENKYIKKGGDEWMVMTIRFSSWSQPPSLPPSPGSMGNPEAGAAAGAAGAGGARTAVGQSVATTVLSRRRGPVSA